MNIVPPCRVTHRYRQRLDGAADELFSLMCPVREADWVHEWMPSLVVTGSGVAEEDCVFVTGENDERAVWYITRHEPEHRHVEMIKIIPDVVAVRLWIDVEPDGPKRSAAEIRYRWTALGPAGEELVSSMDETAYAAFMRAWESALNHYLRTGQKLADQ